MTYMKNAVMSKAFLLVSQQLVHFYYSIKQLAAALVVMVCGENCAPEPIISPDLI